MANLTTRQSEAVTTLLSLWRTGTIPPHAFTKMATVESEALVRFLQKVYWDLRFNGHAAFPFDDEVAFQRYLIQNIETIPQQEAVQKAQEAARRAQAAAEEAVRQAQAEAEAKAKAPALFAALGWQMASTTARETLVQLTRERVDLMKAYPELFPFPRVPAKYQNQCWQCRLFITSNVHARCPVCHWYICTCGACMPHCSGHTL